MDLTNAIYCLQELRKRGNAYRNTKIGLITRDATGEVSTLKQGTIILFKLESTPDTVTIMEPMGPERRRAQEALGSGIRTYNTMCSVPQRFIEEITLPEEVFNPERGMVP